MQIMHYSRILLSLLLFITGICPAMQKPPADMLVGAAAANNIKGLNYWIKTQKVQPNVIDSHGHTPLGRAATNGQYQALAYLVDAGAPINQKDSDGLSPLAWAVIAQDPSKAQEYANIVQYLISKGADVNARDNKGISILHNAARGGNVGIIKMLLDHGANRDINAEGSQEKGRTPIGEALRASKDAIIHIDLENDDFTNAAQQLYAALHEPKKGLGTTCI